MPEGEASTEVPVKKNIFPLQVPYDGENLSEPQKASGEIGFLDNNGLLLKTLIPSIKTEAQLNDSISSLSPEWSDYDKLHMAVTERSFGERPTYDKGVFLAYSILDKAAMKEGTSVPQVSEEHIKACEMDVAILQQDHTAEEVFSNAMKVIRLSDRHFYTALKDMLQKWHEYDDADFVRGAIQTYYPLRFAAESSDRSVTKPFILGRLFKGEQ